MAIYSVTVHINKEPVKRLGFYEEFFLNCLLFMFCVLNCNEQLYKQNSDGV
jgi:hypothetical protein